MLTNYAQYNGQVAEKASRRWLVRYLTEGTPRLRHFAEVAIWRDEKPRCSWPCGPRAVAQLAPWAMTSAACSTLRMSVLTTRS